MTGRTTAIAQTDAPPPTRAEARLAITCARRRLDPRQADRIPQISAEVRDWGWLLRAAGAHGVTALVYRHLARVRPPALPDRVLADLERQCHQIARRNLARTGELLHLLDAFAADGIGAVPLKGPALAMLLYGDVSLRSFGDLDMLVRPGDLDRALRLLEAQGYRAQIPLTHAQERPVPRYTNHYRLIHDHDLCDVELHWELLPRTFPLGPRSGAVWNRLGSVAIHRRTVPALSLEDTALFLCAHGAKHGWCRLAWITDLAELIDGYPALHWRAVWSAATPVGARRVLLVGLALAHDLLGASLPPELAAGTADPAVRSAVQRITENLFTDANHGATRELWQLVPFYARSAERWRDKVRCWYRAVTAVGPGDWRAVRLPDSLAFLYYLVRPVRLLWKHARRIASMPA